MTENEFWSERLALEQRIAGVYDELIASLPRERRPLLAAAQLRWRDCLALFERALGACLDEPVKVFYGVEGQERKTNVYKDTILAMLGYRADDLERWREGGHAPGQPTTADLAAATAAATTADLAAATADLASTTATATAAATAALAEAFGMNIYIMDEVFRVPTQAAQSAWLSWLRSDMEFVGAAAATEEELLQTERMLGLALLQREGYVFFHRERED